MDNNYLLAPCSGDILANRIMYPVMQFPWRKNQPYDQTKWMLAEESPLATLWATGRNGILLLSARGINMLSQFVLFLVISRQMGQEALGVFTFVVSTTILGTYISNLGLDTLITREASHSPADGETLLSSLLSLKLISSVLAYSCINLSFIFLPLDPVIQRQLLIYSVIIFLNSISSLLWFYGDAFDRFLLHGVLWAANHLLRTIAGITVIFFGGFLDRVLMGLVAAEAVSLLLSWFITNRYIGKVRIHARLEVWENSLQKAWPIALGGLLGAISFRIDVSILQILRGSLEVGLYSAAFKIVEVMHVLPSSLSLSIFPRFSRVFRGAGVIQTAQMARRLLLLTLTLGALCSMALFVAAPWVIRLFYGPDFDGSISVLQILVLKIFFMFLALPLSYTLIAVGDERNMTGILALSALSSITINLLLVPLYGRHGSAMATVVSEVLLFLGYTYRLWRLERK